MLTHSGQCSPSCLLRYYSDHSQSLSHASGDYENEVLKNCLGFVMGVGLTLLFYAWLCLQKDYPRFQAAIIRLVFFFRTVSNFNMMKTSLAF